jgi:hypothetical protein
MPNRTQRSPTSTPSRSSPHTEFVRADGTPVERRLVRPLRLAQDGHTSSEHVVYQVLWNAGGRPGERDSFRDISLGASQICRQASVSERNLVRMLRSLKAKLSIEQLELPDRPQSLPRTFRVWSMERILERRREVGFSYVYRSRNSVALVRAVPPDPSGRDNSPPSMASGDILTSCEVTRSTQAAISTKDSLAPAGVAGGDAILASTTGDTLTIPLGNTIRKGRSGTRSENASTDPGTEPSLESPGTSSSSDLILVLEELRNHGLTDDAGAIELIHRCRIQAPDATEEEIVDMIRRKMLGVRIRSSGLGFLLTALPKCFGGEAFRQYRVERIDQCRMEIADRETRICRAESMLAEPDCTEDDREYALCRLVELRRELDALRARLSRGLDNPRVPTR